MICLRRRPAMIATTTLPEPLRQIPPETYDPETYDTARQVLASVTVSDGDVRD
jgi:hypothetical protein